MKELTSAFLAGKPQAEIKETAVTIGFFEGLHQGHRQVISTCVQMAKEEGLVPTLFTFDTKTSPPPKENFSLLTSEEEKRSLLEQLGVEAIFAPPFSAVQECSAGETVDRLLAGFLQAKLVVVGWDLRFGKGAQGDANLLKTLCEAKGISVVIIPPVLDEGEPISATRIRSALEEGNLPEATRLLGRPFAIVEEVKKGNQLGRTLGFPTANMTFPARLVQPARGVYRSQVTLQNGENYSGMTNIGWKPTVGSDLLLAETHLFGFDGELYGQEVRVELLEFLRPEQKFPSLDALSAQLREDALRCKAREV